MMDFSSATLDELSCLELSLQDAIRSHADLDIPLLQDMYDSVIAELEKRNR